MTPEEHLIMKYEKLDLQELETIISDLEIERINVLEVLKDLSSFNHKDTGKEDRLATLEKSLEILKQLCVDHAHSKKVGGN